MISCAIVYDDIEMVESIATFTAALLGADRLTLTQFKVDEVVDVSKCTHVVVCKKSCLYSMGSCTLQMLKRLETTKIFVVLPQVCLPKQAFACVLRGAHEFNTDGPSSPTLFVRLEIFFLGSKPAVLQQHKQWKMSTGHFISVDAIEDLVYLVSDYGNPQKDKRITFHLSGMAMKLLIFLISHRGNAVTREAAHLHLYKVDYTAECRKVDLTIATIRKAFKKHAGIDPIQTNHGSGYAIR